MSLNLFSTLVGESPAMHKLYQDLSGLAHADTPVLLLGESATGKDSAAYELHCESPRSDESFVILNCATIQPDLLEIELFGHLKGAFLGALVEKQGRLGLANNGTLFLDDIDHLPMPIQLKLLNAIQNKAYYPIGADEPLSCDIRLVVGATDSIKQRVDEGYFSAQFYAMFKSATVHIPPLRQRTEDLASLLQVLFSKVQTDEQDVPYIHADAISALENYDWPGNLRELECLVEALVADYPGQVIRLEHLPERYQQGHSKDQLPLGLIQDEMAFLLSSHTAGEDADCQVFLDSDWADHQTGQMALSSSPGLVALPGFDLESGVPMKVFLQQVERELIVGALSKTDGNVSQAAKLLQINRTTLVEKIRKYDLRDSNIA